MVVECIDDADGEGWAHGGFGLLFGHPADFPGFFGGMPVSTGGTASVDQRDDPVGEILVDASQTLYRDREAGFFEDFAPNSILERFAQFKDTAWRLPVAPAAVRTASSPDVSVTPTELPSRVSSR
jgi:hypothetical protein